MSAIRNIPHPLNGTPESARAAYYRIMLTTMATVSANWTSTLPALKTSNGPRCTNLLLRQGDSVVH